MAKTVIKGTISQLSLGNSSSQTMANPFHSLQIYWSIPFWRKYVLLSYTSAYTMLARRWTEVATNDGPASKTVVQH